MFFEVHIGAYICIAAIVLIPTLMKENDRNGDELDETKSIEPRHDRCPLPDHAANCRLGGE